MKKLFAAILLTATLFLAQAQDFSVTNTYNFANSVTAVQKITLGTGMVPVVTSAGAPLTNSSLWATWIPRYVTNQIYTNGITVTNSDVKVLWGEPKAQLRGLYQGNAPVWNGSNYVRLNLAVERILAGERLHVLIGATNDVFSLTNMVQSTNVIYSSYAVIYKVVEIPKTKPAGY